MSVPETPADERRKVFKSLIISITIEEAGISHIINAEGEKIQAISYGILTGMYDEKDAKEIEISINKVLQLAIKLQMLLQFKLELVMEAQTEFEKNLREKLNK